MIEGYRECPYCGEKIKRFAKKCRFCSEFLENGHNTDSGISRTDNGKSDTGASFGEFLFIFAVGIGIVLSFYLYILPILKYIGLS